MRRLKLPLAAAISFAAVVLAFAFTRPGDDAPAGAAPAGSVDDGAAAPPASTGEAPGDSGGSGVVTIGSPSYLPARPEQPGRAFLAVRVEKPLQTRYGTVAPKTALGSNTWLLVLRRTGARALVLLPGKPTGRTVRLDLREFDVRWTTARILIDKSDRRMELWDGSEHIDTWRVAIGASDSPTPEGRFSVTDRVAFPDGGQYGSFALGLSVHQTAELAGWHGGDQVAVHGTPRPELLGQPVSFGCVRAAEGAMATLRRYVGLGAPVTIRA